MKKNSILDKNFYRRDTRKVAQDLLGKLLVREIDGNRISGLIVETEAYRGFNDTASHGHKGVTKRCEVMFGEPGFAYVYLTYGIHHMFNVVTERKDFPSAVLIRAVEPLEGIEKMFRNRSIRKKDVVNLTSGPGKLTEAISVDRELNGLDLTEKSKVWIEECETSRKEWLSSFSVKKGPRIGIDYADEEARGWNWRFFVKGNKFVSQ